MTPVTCHHTNQPVPQIMQERGQLVAERYKVHACTVCSYYNMPPCVHIEPAQKAEAQQ